MYVIAVPVRNVNKSGVRTNLATGGHVTFPPYACCPSNVINVSNFCNSIFRGFRSTRGQSPRFPIDFAGYRYNSAALMVGIRGVNCKVSEVDYTRRFVQCSASAY